MRPVCSAHARMLLRPRISPPSSRTVAFSAKHAATRSGSRVLAAAKYSLSSSGSLNVIGAPSCNWLGETLGLQLLDSNFKGRRSCNGLNLCEAAIHEQFRSGDVAAVVGREEHHGLGDFIGCTKAAERNSVGDHLAALLACFR